VRRRERRRRGRVRRRLSRRGVPHLRWFPFRLRSGRRCRLRRRQSLHERRCLLERSLRRDRGARRRRVRRRQCMHVRGSVSERSLHGDRSRVVWTVRGMRPHARMCRRDGGRVSPVPGGRSGRCPGARSARRPASAQVAVDGCWSDDRGRHRRSAHGSRTQPVCVRPRGSPSVSAGAATPACGGCGQDFRRGRVRGQVLAPSSGWRLRLSRERGVQRAAPRPDTCEGRLPADPSRGRRRAPHALEPAVVARRDRAARSRRRRVLAGGLRRIRREERRERIQIPRRPRAAVPGRVRRLSDDGGFPDTPYS